MQFVCWTKLYKSEGSGHMEFIIIIKFKNDKFLSEKNIEMI
jgi:hypothetical protein